jgi:hypothetical protein
MQRLLRHDTGQHAFCATRTRLSARAIKSALKQDNYPGSGLLGVQRLQNPHEIGCLADGEQRLLLLLQPAAAKQRQAVWPPGIGLALQKATIH